jgi:OPA family sugar phosphate sensor protein UhpC-like MFS transporter
LELIKGSVSFFSGGALIAIFGSYLSEYFGWRYTLFIPGALSILVSFFLADRIRDSPQHVGIVFLDHLPFKKEQMPPKKSELPLRVALVDHILKSKAIWLLGVAGFIHYIVRYAVSDWGILYLVREQGFTAIQAGTCLFWFEIGASIGAFIAGTPTKQNKSIPFFDFVSFFAHLLLVAV